MCILSENIFSVIFLVFSIGLVLVRKLRERHHTDGPGGGGGGGDVGGGGVGGVVVEGELETVGGSESVLQSRDVIFPSEEADGGTSEDQPDYDRRLAENYSNISLREKYSNSDQWGERTHIKLNPLYHNYS